jgi:hypothetical protein
MTEQLQQPQDDFHTSVIDHAFGKFPEDRTPEQQYLHTEYTLRSLIPTNNLQAYLTNEPKSDDELGRMNNFDYHNRTFGFAFNKLKTERPDLWDRALNAKALAADFDDTEIERAEAILQASVAGDIDEFNRLRTQKSESFWAREAVFTEVYDYLAPILAAEGIAPIIVCL